MTLALWDIDGTLIHAGTLWNQSFMRAICEIHPGAAENLGSFNGKTDRLICREALRFAGMSSEALDETTSRILERYLSHAAAGLPGFTQGPRVLPGVPEALKALRGQCEVSLLTGNLRAGAKMKLLAAQLDHFFDFECGAFADDHWDRNELPAFAAKRAGQKQGALLSGQDLVVIGDTIHDVACGKRFGARTIAVGTGRNVDQGALRASDPDWYFEDFTDTDRVLRAILEG